MRSERLAPCPTAFALNAALNFKGASKPIGDAGLVGMWQLARKDDCAVHHAARLRIEPNGLYFGEAEPPGAFTWWDGGTWRVPSPGRLALSIANDAVVDYGYALDGDNLVITDASGCKVVYRRVP
jgi:hypothetical protein